MQSVRRLCLLIAILAVLSMVWRTQASYAATFYVAIYGDDANPGTEALPFQTLQRGVRVLRAGDTLMVQGGTYQEVLIQVIPSGTSWSQPVTVQAAPGETVVLQATAPTDEVVVDFEDNSQYIILDGFILDANNVAGWAFGIGNASHIRVQNCEMKNARYSGVQVGGHSHELSNLDVHDNGYEDTPLGHGLYLLSANTLVEHSRFYRNAGYGMQNYNSAGGVNNNTIHANMIYENGEGGLWVGKGTGHTVSDNTIWGNYGVGLTLSAPDSKIDNNTIYDNPGNSRDKGLGIVILDSNDWGVEITNNIVYDNPGGSIDGVTNATLSGNQFD